MIETLFRTNHGSYLPMAIFHLLLLSTSQNLPLKAELNPGIYCMMREENESKNTYGQTRGIINS